MTLIDDIVSMLTAYSNIRAYQFDSSTIDQIVICEYPGQTPIHSSSSTIRRPGISIMVRDASLATAESRALAIWQILKKSKSVPNHQLVSAASSGLVHDVDDNGLHIFVMSFYVFD